MHNTLFLNVVSFAKVNVVTRSLVDVQHFMTLVTYVVTCTLALL